MTIDPRTPVLVGTASIVQRETEPGAGKEAVALMADAVLAAAEDSGAPELLERTDLLMVPRGMWGYPDPARHVADLVGAGKARSLVSEIGILQTSLFGRAGRAISEGEADVVVITGGEAKYRNQLAERAGVELREAQQPEMEPDEVMRPAADILHPLELTRGLGRPVSQYAILESALRKAQGFDPESHRDDVARMWAGMSSVAEGNPHAWKREPVSAELIRGGEGNHMMAFPYTKLHNSEWNVDQAAALLLCSYETARAAGVAAEKLVFLRAVTESNHMLPLAERAHPESAPASRISGARALELAGISQDEVTHRELYSCFPAAVRIQARELGVPLDPAPSVTGGMAFGGGPLNNFVLQAAARMAEVLRAEGGHGFVSAISGMLTKLGASVWSKEPGTFAFDDVSEAVAAETESVEVVEGEAAAGQGTVVGYTVIHGREGAQQAVALCDLEGGRRTIAFTTDPGLMDAMMREEYCSRTVSIAPDGAFSAA
jgi:acetyl-CoA C-acetyltransferase